MKKIVVIGMAVLALATGACKSKSTVVEQPCTEHNSVNTVTPPTRHEDSPSRDAKALIREAEKWIGTPYVYGGQSRTGTDCSGFVLEVFKSVLDVKLPRSAREQRDYCRQIDKDDMTAGDLLFFSSKKSGGSTSHVGMYIGDGQMIHASSSRGVVISALSESYYVTHFQCAGRVPALEKSNAKSQNKPSQPAPVQQPKENKPKETKPVERKPVVSKPVEQKPIEEKPVVVAPETKPEPKPTEVETPPAEDKPSPATMVRNAFSKQQKK